MELTIKILSIIKEILVALAAVVVAVVAFKGLHTWRNQLLGTTKYQLSKRILEKVYALKGALDAARRPPYRVAIGEIQEGNEDCLFLIKAIEKEHKVYSKGLISVNKAYNDLQLTKLEAKAVWGEQKIDNIQALLEQVIQLKLKSAWYFNSKPHNVVSKLRGEKIDKQIEHTDKQIEHDVFGGGGDKDKFNKKLDEIILEIENQFEKELKRKLF